MEIIRMISMYISGFVIGYLGASAIYWLLTFPAAKVTIYYRRENGETKKVTVIYLETNKGTTFFDGFLKDTIRKVDNTFPIKIEGLKVEDTREWIWEKETI